MAVEEYKALTHINLPFLPEEEGRFDAGKMIPVSAFEQSAAKAAELLDDRTAKDPNASTIMTAEENIAELIKWGSLSEDPDAELHPDHIPVDPNGLSLASLVANAEALIEQLKSENKEVPEYLTSLVETHFVTTSEKGTGRDQHV